MINYEDLQIEMDEKLNAILRKSCQNQRAKVLEIIFRTAGINVCVKFVHVQVRTQKSDFDWRVKVARNSSQIKTIV